MKNFVFHLLKINFHFPTNHYGIVICGFEYGLNEVALFCVERDSVFFIFDFCYLSIFYYFFKKLYRFWRGMFFRI